MLLWCLALTLFMTVESYGQNSASEELTPLIGTPLKEAHVNLLKNGYEIAQSSLFNTKQMWYNESKSQCVTFIFSKEEGHEITSIEPTKESKCIQGVKASRKVWASYIDGGSEADSKEIEIEREKLRQQGCEVSYWIKDVSPGKTMEVWYNEAEQICKSIIWDNATKASVKVIDRDPRLGKNPAPTYNAE